MEDRIDIGYPFGRTIDRRIIKITSPFFIILLLFLLLFFGSIGGASAALDGNVIAPVSVNVCESTGYVIYINNTGTTPENDIFLNVTIPPGFKYDDGTTVITFPDCSSYQDPEIKGDGRYLEWNLTDIMTTGTGVVINEVLPNPVSGNDGSKERVELYNAGDTAVNVDGWYINDTAGNKRDIQSYIISGDVNMTPGSFLVISIRHLDDGGDEVILYDNLGDEIDRVVYPTSPVGKSWASMPDGSECWNWRDSTLGATNGDLPAGESIRVDFNLTAGCDAVSGGRIRSDVSYIGGSVPGSSKSILVKRGFLKLTKTPTVVEAGVGDVVDWAITLENTGLGPAFNVLMNDTLSSGLHLLSIDSPGGGMNWSYGSIAPGDAEVVNISVNVTGCSDLFNLINASWGCGASPCQETYAKASVKFLPRDPDLEYTVSPMVVPYCGSVTVYVNVTNEGEGGITELELQFDGISADYAVTNVTGATFYPVNETFFIGRVAAGEWRNFTFDFGMEYGACAATGASGNIIIYPGHYDDCGNPWSPPVSLKSYSMNVSTIPSVSVSKTANRSVMYLGDEVEFDLAVTYTAGFCEDNTTRTIVDRYPANFTLLDFAEGEDDSVNRTITWADQLLEDGVTWNKTIRLRADRDAAACDCGGLVANELTVSQGLDCCGCPLSGSDSAQVVLVCINETVLASSSKTADPVPQENCRNITYTNTYTFAADIGALNWTGMNFTELGGNGQVFPDGSTSGTATFTVNGCSTEEPITIGTPKNLGFLNGACGPLGGGTVLKVTYTLGQPQTWSGYDWSRLCIDGYGTECEGDGCLYEAAFVTVSRADYSIGISGVPTRLDTCEVIDVIISITKGSDDDDPKWIGHDMYVVYNDENYRYIGPATFSGITNYVSPTQSDPVASFEPTRVGDDLIWYLGANISRGGTITFPVEKRCPDDGQMTARLNYTDNCGELLERSASATPSLILSGNIIIQKNPEVIFALDKNASWKIYVTNTGAGTAYNVTVNDTLDSDLSYVGSRIDGSADPANTTVVDANHVIWSLGDMPPKKQRVIELDAVLVGCENLNNRVQAVWGCGDEECQTPVIDFSVVELVDGELIIARHDADPIDDCGANSTFVIEVRNGAGPTLYNITVKETLPQGLEYVSGSAQVTGANPTSTSLSGRYLEWRFDQPEGWQAGKRVTITFNATVTSDPCEFDGGEAVARVNYTVPCGDYGREIDNFLTLGKTDRHVSITKIPEEMRAEPWTIVEWTIRIQSNGADPATNVTLFDILPANTDYVSATPVPNSTAPLRWDFGTLDVGEERTVILRANITSCVDETENNATVTWGCCPDDMGSESGFAVLRTQPVIDLSKEHDYIDTCGGNFTITINNSGSSAYTSEVRDVLPVGFVYKTGSAVIRSDNATHDASITNYEPVDYSGVNGTVIWKEANFDRIYPDETITITFEVESCVDCCNVSTAPNENLVYFNYTNRCADPFSKSFTDPVTPKLAVLKIEKTPFNQTIGGSAQWTIKVTNSGDGVAYNVTVIDVLGDGFVGVAEGDGNKTNDDPIAGYTTIRWTNLTIPVGGTWERQLTAAGISSGSLVNNAYVFGTCENGCIYSQDQDVAYTARINITKDPDSVETIGGFSNFTIRVEYWGDGEYYNNTRIVDTLPAGLKYDSHDCILDTNNEGCGDFDVTGNVLTWDLGNFTGSRIIEINLSTIVENVIENQDGKVLVNRVKSLHEDVNGTVFEDGDEAKVTVVEPDLSIYKDSDPESPVKVGDEILYTLKVNHTGSSSSTAYDLVIDDVVPPGLTFVDGSASNAGTYYDTNRTIIWTFNNLSYPGSDLVLTYNVTVDEGVIAGTDLINKANVTWTSTPGPNPDERFGNFTQLDDYNDTVDWTLTVDISTGIIKLPDIARNQTIGETIDYTIEVDLPKANVTDLWVNDTLPRGLRYETGSLVVENSTGSDIKPLLITETVSTPNDGTQVVFISWWFGEFDNSNDQDIVIKFNATIANVINNQDGDVLVNSAHLNWTDRNGQVQTDTNFSGPVYLEEPDLSIYKDSDPESPVKVGDEILYTLKVNHTGSSSSTAYDLVID
ncbi:isopeptide-forming domain-containing fimbrial protein, partial [Methanotrichaceae archaeon Mx]|nr:isopeptide-forming domain-containing fimbrial protein [Candidatus Methanocrinis natronophilus]